MYVDPDVEPDPSAGLAGSEDPVRPGGYKLSRITASADGSEYDLLPIDTPIELELAATPDVQRWTCEQRCQVEEPFQCPDDPADLPDENPNAETLFDDPLAHSIWYYDAGKTIIENRFCTQHVSPNLYFYEWSRTISDGCMVHAEGCAYERAELPAGVELPCTDYEVRGGVPYLWELRHPI
jgi:hypothetical protein